MHGHLWCVNGVIFAISESLYWPKPSIKFLPKRIYGLEKDVGWKILKWPSLICEWDDFCCFWVAIMPEAFLKFLLKRIYMVWKEMVVEEFQDGCLVHGHLWCVNGVIFAISESPNCPKPSIKFLLKRKYGLEEDVGWKIAGWLFRAWQSLMCEWSYLSYFWVSMLLEAFHQVSAQGNIWYGRWSWMKISFCKVIFDVWMGWF